MKRLMPRNYLAAWRTHRHMTQDQLASAAGTSKPTISRLESGNRGLSQKWLERLAPILDATPAQLLAAPAAATKAQTARLLPLIDTVQAGKWTEVAEPYPLGDAARWVPAAAHAGPRAFALKIEGTSMVSPIPGEPSFYDGDVVVIDPDREARPGCFVVARIDEENAATFKRLRIKSPDAKRPVVELVPLNPDWPVLPLDHRKGGRIVGVATDHYRKLI